MLNVWRKTTIDGSTDYHIVAPAETDEEAFDIIGKDIETHQWGFWYDYKIVPSDDSYGGYPIGPFRISEDYDHSNSEREGANNVTRI